MCWPISSGGGCRPRTVQQAYAVLRLALNAAVKRRKLKVNPATLIDRDELPAQVRAERVVWTRADVRRFLAATADDPMGPLWAVQLWTGLRPSETLALKWADLDLDSDKPQLRVMRSLYRPKRNTREWTLEATKTEKSRAPVPLVPQAVDMLRRHRDRQAADRLVAGERYEDHGFVFARPTGEPLWAGIVSKQWRQVTAAAGMPPMRLYDCRHTCATLLLEAGVPMRVVQEILRHSTMTLTANTYSHVRPTMTQQAMAQLADFVNVNNGDGTPRTL